MAAAAPNPYTVPPPSPYAAPYAAPVNPNAPSPGLAFVLGLFIQVWARFTTVNMRRA